MTFSQAYIYAVEGLTPLYGAPEAASLAGRLLEQGYGLSRLDRVVRGETAFARAEEFRVDVARLVAWEPLQYVVGWEEFCGRRFEVSSETLIPRPETEELAQRILTGGARGRMLDIGTGSGALAVTLAGEWPEAEVEAWDISRGALRVAARNAERLGVAERVRLVERDVLSYSPEPSQRGRFSLVVSNPPYVCSAEKCSMRPNVLEYEPHGALFVPDGDPLLFYRAIASLPLLERGGELWLEINESYGREVASLLVSRGFTAVEVLADFRGCDRVVRGVWEGR